MSIITSALCFSCGSKIELFTYGVTVKPYGQSSKLGKCTPGQMATPQNLIIKCNDIMIIYSSWCHIILEQNQW